MTLPTYLQIFKFRIQWFHFLETSVVAKQDESSLELGQERSFDKIFKRLQSGFISWWVELILLPMCWDKDVIKMQSFILNDPFLLFWAILWLWLRRSKLMGCYISVFKSQFWQEVEWNIKFKNRFFAKKNERSSHQKFVKLWQSPFASMESCLESVFAKLTWSSGLRFKNDFADYGFVFDVMMATWNAALVRLVLRLAFPGAQITC